MHIITIIYCTTIGTEYFILAHSEDSEDDTHTKISGKRKSVLLA